MAVAKIFDGTNWITIGSGVTAAGENNTGSDVGVGGVAIFKQKSGVDLEFRSVNAASSKISVALDAGNNEVDFDVTEANLTLQNLGGVLTAVKGGTGQSTFTKGDIFVATGASTLVKLAVGSNDQVLTADSGEASGTKWGTAPASLLPWTEVGGTSQTMAVNNGYITINASLTTLTLPTTAAVGDVLRIVMRGTGIAKIAQGASQQIRYAGQFTTPGATGHLDSIIVDDAIELVCTIVNNDWNAISMIGDWDGT